MLFITIVRSYNWNTHLKLPSSTVSIQNPLKLMEKALLTYMVFGPRTIFDSCTKQLGITLS